MRRHSRGIGSRISAALDNIAEWLGYLGAILTAVLVFMIFVNVSLRYFITKTVPHSFDFSCLLFAMVVVLSSAYADKHNAHVTVDALVTRLPQRVRAWLSLLVNVASAALVGYICYIFWDYAAEALRRGETAPAVLWLHVWPFKAVWFIGFGLLSLMLIKRVVRNIGTLRGLSYG